MGKCHHITYTNENARATWLACTDDRILSFFISEARETGKGSKETKCFLWQ